MSHLESVGLHSEQPPSELPRRRMVDLSAAALLILVGDENAPTAFPPWVRSSIPLSRSAVAAGPGRAPALCSDYAIRRRMRPTTVPIGNVMTHGAPPPATGPDVSVKVFT